MARVYESMSSRAAKHAGTLIVLPVANRAFAHCRRNDENWLPRALWHKFSFKACLSIRPSCSRFFISASISGMINKPLDIFDIHTRHEPSNLRLIDQIRSSRKIVSSPTLPLALSFPYPFPFSSSRRFSSNAALINAKCVNACGKLPRCSPDGLNSSAKRPK